MGCLKAGIRFVICVFAIIGVIAVFQGKVEFNLKNAKTVDRGELISQAKPFGDFSKLQSDYKLSKTLDVMGYKKMTVIHTPSDQKTVFLDTKNKITEKDFQNKNIENLLIEKTLLFSNLPINIQNLTITKRGSLIINKKASKYILFEGDVENLPYDKIKGIMGIYKIGERNILYLSMRNAKKFSFKINQDILSIIKY